MEPEPNSDKKHSRLWRDMLETVGLTLLMFLVLRFAIQNFNIDGTSMEPNLHNAELVLVDKLTYLFHPPTRGDIIVFAAPPEPTDDYVKRVIAVPGDTVTVQGTTVIVDGVTLNEGYIAAQNQGTPPGTHAVTNQIVPPGDYFVLGDNRAVSSDSRIWGFVPRKNIIGRAALVYWPLGKNNDGLVPGVSTVFASIHQNNNQGPFSAVNALWLLLVPAFLLLFRQRKTIKRWFTPTPQQRTEPEP
jgi:signal peptidase I